MSSEVQIRRKCSKSPDRQIKEEETVYQNWPDRIRITCTECGTTTYSKDGQVDHDFVVEWIPFAEEEQLTKTQIGAISTEALWILASEVARLLAELSEAQKEIATLRSQLSAEKAAHQECLRLLALRDQELSHEQG